MASATHTTRSSATSGCKNSLRRCEIGRFSLGTQRQPISYCKLRSLKLRVATMDLKIAAIALIHGATVLTRNEVDFQQIPNLDTDDWLA